MDKNQWYRSIPKVDILLEKPDIQKLIKRYGRMPVMDSIREHTEALRSEIKNSEDESEIRIRLEHLETDICEAVVRLYTPDMCRVINGTGTILHTNLGRAPISRELGERVLDVLTGYSNLEYDLESGGRGERYAHFEKLLCKITGAEAAMAVNNNAAAVMLVLSSMAAGGEVIVSRGELVEIGGKFRVPDVMEQSGARLVEVGTTNKTHLSDYIRSITEETRAILKVHTSNYRIVGFTEDVSSAELVSAVKDQGIPVIEDLGSGVLADLSKYGLEQEPMVQKVVADGVDVVCFSGDKLLGGPQAGIIVGKKKYIDQMKKNPLTRAFRIGKFTAAALELTFMEYLSLENAEKHIPVLQMIQESGESVLKRAAELQKLMLEVHPDADIRLEESRAQIGGGSLPLEYLPSTAVAIRSDIMRPEEMEEKMRHLQVPIVPRIMNDAVYLDVRTIPSEQFELVAKMFGELQI